MNVLSLYVEAFTRCYPEARVKLVRAHNKRVTNEPQWWVNIRGSHEGSEPMTLADLAEATREFSANGRKFY